MNRAEKIIDIYNKFGSKDYIGEKMTQTEHALQCAYYAKNNNYDKDIIISALLHDIGHLLDMQNPSETSKMDNYGVAKHEELGAKYLSNCGFNLVISFGNGISKFNKLVLDKFACTLPFAFSCIISPTFM